MRKRTRYLFIVFGFVVFFILAPLGILYINGLRFNFDETGYEPTGILVAKTDPKGAQLFLNDKLVGKTPATIRFLNPGEYHIRIHSDGYQDWTKRLEVKGGKVTWANLYLDKILLIREKPASVSIGSDALDFALAGDQIIYLTSADLVLAQANNPGQNQNFTLPKAVNTIIPLNDSGIYLLRGDTTSLIFSLGDKKFTDISGLVLPENLIAITPDGDLLSLEQNKLYQINLTSKRKTILASNVSAFTLLNRDLYYVQSDKGEDALKIAPLGELPANADTVLLASIPAAQTSEIIVTAQKEIVLMLDRSVYRVNSQLEPIANNVLDWDLGQNEDVLTITTAGELVYYGFTDNSTHLITRAGAAISNARVRAAEGYAFFLMQNQLHALELDNRDGQNDYVVASGLASAKFLVNNNVDTVYLMDGGEITTLQIR